MKITHLSKFTKGWFYGNFKPAIIKAQDTEIGIRLFRQGELSPPHTHKIATEITVVLDGRMRVNGKRVFEGGDIFTVFPNEVTSAEFLEETLILIVKTPSAPGDKYEV